MVVFTYIAVVLSLVFTAHAEDLFNKGYEVFKRSCSTCHWESATPEQIAKIREVVKAGKKPPFKAPPMSEVSARVKKFYPKEKEFIAFVKDYITNPSKEKGVCMPMAFELFGVMPPIGRTLSEEEKEAVAHWLYHRFTDTWEEFIKKHPH
jgi:hypothetical protein